MPLELLDEWHLAGQEGLSGIKVMAEKLDKCGTSYKEEARIIHEYKADMSKKYSTQWASDGYSFFNRISKVRVAKWTDATMKVSVQLWVGFFGDWSGSVQLRAGLLANVDVNSEVSACDRHR